MAERVDTRLFYYPPPGVMKNAGLEWIHHRMRAPVDTAFEQRLKDEQGRESVSHADFDRGCRPLRAAHLSQKTAALGCETHRKNL